MLYLGIDTSCYTTSFAIVDQDQKLILDQRKLLQVNEGEGGLRQSDGVFKHIQNITELTKAFNITEKITAIGVSLKPRPRDDSYMPVFTVGVAMAQCLSALNSIPLFYTSHQEGHLAAGLWSAGLIPQKDFLAVHISGGTSELLHVKPLGNGYNIELLGGTLDLHAGQLIDRVGVAIGLKFPCGKELEKLALSLDNETQLRLHGHVKGLSFNLSGAETEAKKFLAHGHPSAEVAFAVFRVLANSLEKVLLKAINDTGLKEIVLVGGVASNSLIKKRLKERLEHPSVGAKLFFAEPKYATDNAVGTALLTRKNFIDLQEYDGSC